MIFFDIAGRFIRGMFFYLLFFFRWGELIRSPVKDNDAALASAARIKFVRPSRRIDKRKSVLTSTAEGTLACTRCWEVGKSMWEQSAPGIGIEIHLNIKYRRHICRLVFSIANVTIRDKFGSARPDILLLSLARACIDWYSSRNNNGTPTDLFPSRPISDVAHAAAYNSQYRLIACAVVIRGARTLRCVGQNDVSWSITHQRARMRAEFFLPSPVRENFSMRDFCDTTISNVMLFLQLILNIFAMKLSNMCYRFQVSAKNLDSCVCGTDVLLYVSDVSERRKDCASFSNAWLFNIKRNNRLYSIWIMKHEV